MNVLLEIIHAGDLSGPPTDWRVWREVLPPKTRKLYELLREPQYAESTQPVSLYLLSRQLGQSRTAILLSLRELEDRDFLTTHETDGTMSITVSEPPIPQSADVDALDTIGRSVEERDSVKADRIVKLWVVEYGKAKGSQYVPRPQDWKMAKRLLHQVTTSAGVIGPTATKLEHWTEIDEIIKVMRFFWAHYNADDRQDFGGFYSHYSDLLQQRDQYLEGFV